MVPGSQELYNGVHNDHYLSHLPLSLGWGQEAGPCVRSILTPGRSGLDGLEARLQRTSPQGSGVNECSSLNEVTASKSEANVSSYTPQSFANYRNDLAIKQYHI